MVSKHPTHGPSYVDCVQILSGPTVSNNFVFIGRDRKICITDGMTVLLKGDVREALMLRKNEKDNTMTVSYSPGGVPQVFLLKFRSAESSKRLLEQYKLFEDIPIRTELHLINVMLRECFTCTLALKAIVYPQTTYDIFTLIFTNYFNDFYNFLDQWRTVFSVSQTLASLKKLEKQLDQSISNCYTFWFMLGKDDTVMFSETDYDTLVIRFNILVNFMIELKIRL
jgi:hypothetical protein